MSTIYQAEVWTLIKKETNVIYGLFLQEISLCVCMCVCVLMNLFIITSGTPGYQSDAGQGPYTPQTPGTVYSSDHNYSPYQPEPSPSGYQRKSLTKVSVAMYSHIIFIIIFMSIHILESRVKQEYHYKIIMKSLVFHC